MFTFIMGIIISIAFATSFLWGKKIAPRKVQLPASVIGTLLGAILIVWSTTLYVGPSQGGEITRKFGKSLPSGRIIATDHGEKGPQARVLSPGWHFWYWPWLYKLEPHDNIDINEGQVGVVTARDGKSLKKGEIYAPEWPDPTKMLDGEAFMSGEGYKGPQLTFLPPAQYRYNSKLFKIDVKPALNVKVGEVAVIKANAGNVYTNSNVEVVNGTPIVPEGYRGIWNKALMPMTYYLHPNAFEVKRVQTVKRVYSYTASGAMSTKSDRPEQNNSVRVRTADGYNFPVDVRVSVKIDAMNAPYTVALLGDPDGDPERDGFDILEEKAVLPSLRSIFRNSAEDKKALIYVNSRSAVETTSTEKFTKDMEKYKVDVDSVYVAEIGLDKTDEGAALLKTQTDKELALQEQETYKEQVKAEEQRAKVVEAQEAADQQKNIQAALASVSVKEHSAQARLKEAEGEAGYNAKVIESMGGVDNYVLMQIAKLVKEGWENGGNIPNTLVVGDGSGGKMNTAVLAKMLQSFSQE